MGLKLRCKREKEHTSNKVLFPFCCFFFFLLNEEVLIEVQIQVGLLNLLNVSRVTNKNTFLTKIFCAFILERESVWLHKPSAIGSTPSDTVCIWISFFLTVQTTNSDLHLRIKLNSFPLIHQQQSWRSGTKELSSGTSIWPYCLLLSCSKATICLQVQFTKIFCWLSAQRNRIHLPV